MRDIIAAATTDAFKGQPLLYLCCLPSWVLFKTCILFEFLLLIENWWFIHTVCVSIIIILYLGSDLDTSGRHRLWIWDYNIRMKRSLQSPNLVWSWCCRLGSWNTYWVRTACWAASSAWVSPWQFYRGISAISCSRAASYSYIHCACTVYTHKHREITPCLCAWVYFPMLSISGHLYRDSLAPSVFIALTG